MSKKDKIKNIDMDDLKALPDVLDGRHHVIPIVTGGDEVLEEVNVPEILPILTLRSSVLFPGAITPITVGREKSIRLVREVNERNGLLGAVLQRESEVEDPAPDDMYKVGTAARIIKILEMPNGNLTVILNGLEKIEVKEYVSTEPYFQASVTPLRDSSPDVKSLEFEALVDSIRDIALGIIAISPDMPKEAAFAIKNIDSKRGIINFICSNLELSDEDRQSLLESPGLLARARKLLEILVREQQLVELKNEIQSRVKQEIDKMPGVTGSGREAGKIYVAQDVDMVLAKAENIADSMKDEYVSVEHLMLSLMENPNRNLKEIFKLFDIRKNDFLKALQEVRGNTRVTSDSPEGTYDVLKKYGHDLVEDAREKKLDPVIGRDSEIRDAFRNAAEAKTWDVQNEAVTYTVNGDEVTFTYQVRTGALGTQGEILRQNSDYVDNGVLDLSGYTLQETIQPVAGKNDAKVYPKQATVTLGDSAYTCDIVKTGMARAAS